MESDIFESLLFEDLAEVIYNEEEDSLTPAGVLYFTAIAIATLSYILKLRKGLKNGD